MQEYLFGPWKIAAEEVFVTSPHCFAFGEPAVSFSSASPWRLAARR